MPRKARGGIPGGRRPLRRRWRETRPCRRRCRSAFRFVRWKNSASPAGTRPAKQRPRNKKAARKSRVILATQNGRSNPVRISWKRSEKVNEFFQIVQCSVARAPSLSRSMISRTLIPIRFRTSSADSPATRTTFLRLLSPDAMVTEERGTFKRFAKNSMQDWLALLSTGGAVKESLSAPPISPVMTFFFARGWTLTAKLAPRCFLNGNQECLSDGMPKNDKNKDYCDSHIDQISRHADCIL